MESVNSIASFMAASHSVQARPPTQLIIELTAPFEFTYTCVRSDTGEAIWRWPQQNAPNTQRLKPAGQIFDLVA